MPCAMPGAMPSSTPTCSNACPTFVPRCAPTCPPLSASAPACPRESPLRPRRPFDMPPCRRVLAGMPAKIHADRADMTHDVGTTAPTCLPYDPTMPGPHCLGRSRPNPWQVRHRVAAHRACTRPGNRATSCGPPPPSASGPQRARAARDAGLPNLGAAHMANAPQPAMALAVRNRAPPHQEQLLLPSCLRDRAGPARTLYPSPSSEWAVRRAAASTAHGRGQPPGGGAAPTAVHWARANSARDALQASRVCANSCHHPHNGIRAQPSVAGSSWCSDDRSRGVYLARRTPIGRSATTADPSTRPPGPAEGSGGESSGHASRRPPAWLDASSSVRRWRLGAYQHIGGDGV